MYVTFLIQNNQLLFPGATFMNCSLLSGRQNFCNFELFFCILGNLSEGIEFLKSIKKLEKCLKTLANPLTKILSIGEFLTWTDWFGVFKKNKYGFKASF